LTPELSAATLILHDLSITFATIANSRPTIPRKILLFCGYCGHHTTQSFSAIRTFPRSSLTRSVCESKLTRNRGDSTKAPLLL
jgi:hypothetical protein